MKSKQEGEGGIIISANESINKLTVKSISHFIIRFIMITFTSFIYVEGMLKLTILTPGTSPIIFGIKRGILLYLHIDLYFYIVKPFFQNTFPFNKSIGLVVSLLAWAIGLIIPFWFRL